MMDQSFVLAGLITGFIVGLTGVGGGALMTPILLFFFGVAPTTAIATDLWFAAITKCVGAIIHNDAGKIDWQIVRRLWAGSLPVALLTVALVSAGDKLNKVDWLSNAIGLLVIVTGIGLLAVPKVLKWARYRRINEPETFKLFQPILTAMAGTVLGICVALTSVGAGALGSVFLCLLYPLRMTPHRLVATDLVHAIPLAIVAGASYAFVGLVDGQILLSLLCGSVPSIIVSSMLARKLNGRFIQIALAIVLIVIGIKSIC